MSTKSTTDRAPNIPFAKPSTVGLELKYVKFCNRIRIPLLAVGMLHKESYFGVRHHIFKYLMLLIPE